MPKATKLTIEELQAQLGDLDPKAKVIWVESEDEMPVLLSKHAETLSVGKYLFKFLRNKAKKIILIYGMLLSFFPELVPTPMQIAKTIYDHTPQIIASIDFSFPYPVPDTQKPWISFPDTLPNGSSHIGATYYASGSGIAPQVYQTLG